MNSIQTHIESVTVYPDRALITRRGEATLIPGASEVLVAGLPLDLDVESLRASGRGEVGVRIIGVEARERPLTESNNEAARETQRKLDLARDAGKLLQSQSAILENRAQTLHKLSGDAARWFAESLAKGESSLDNFSAMLDYVAVQTRQLNAERAALEPQKRENEALQNALETRLEQWEDDFSSEHIVAVLVESSAQGKWELELSYIVRGASWTPLYDARVSTTPEQERFELSLNALVSHRSGEDWNDVALTLSTARPGLGTLPPKLETIWLNNYQPAPILARASITPKAAMSRARFADAAEEGDFDSMSGAAMAAPAPIEAQHVEATIESEGATVEFKLPHRLSVPGDGQTHRVSIATREFPAKFDYLSIPRRVEIAYLRATATNNSQLSLLEGAVSVFRDGVFVGKANFKNTAPNGEFTLFLGPDDQVRAKRELTLREADKNFLGSQKRVHFAYTIEVQNLKPRVVKLLLQDQIPVSRSENIKVKLRSSAPEAHPGELGVLNWELVLQPNEKRTVRFDFAVESPRETQVVGLND